METMKRPLILGALLLLSIPSLFAAEPIDFDRMTSPILLRGDARTAYRDPTVLFHDGTFHLFCTKVAVEDNDEVYSYTVQCRSRDLVRWSKPETITPRDRSLNYSSPGNVVRHDGKWFL